MAYEPIGSPSGNNLYITIPQRGTQNWDEKLKTGFFDKVSEHDHTPGKGAAIKEVALDAPLQTKISQIATNTSEIAQNAVDISQNAANILTNVQDIASNNTDIAALDTRLTTAESNISSNDTDISAIDTRLTTAESNITSNDTDISALDTRVTTLEGSSSSSSYTLNNTNAQSDLPSYLSNADVLIDTTVGTTISNKEFENVRFSLDARITFQNCTFRNCFIGEGDNVTVPYHLSLTDSTAYSTEIMGMATVNIDRTNFYRGSIKARTLEIDNTTATSSYAFANNFVNVNDNVNIIGNSSYTTEFNKNDVRCSVVTLLSAADDSIELSNSKLDALRVGSNSYFVSFIPGSAPTIISHETGTSGSIFKLRDSLGTTIANLSGGVPAFKILDGAYSVYDKGGNTDIIVSARGALVTIGSNTDQPVISGTGASYDPDSVVSNGDVTLDAGNYLISALVNTANAGIVTLKVIITPSGGSANTIFTITNGTDPVSLNDLIIAANQGDVLSVKFAAQLASQSVTTLYTLKKII